MFLDFQSIDKILIIYQKELNLFKKEVWFFKTITNVHDIYKKLSLSGVKTPFLSDIGMRPHSPM